MFLVSLKPKKFSQFLNFTKNRWPPKNVYQEIVEKVSYKLPMGSVFFNK